MFDLKELYQEVIVDHNRNPRNCYEMADACHCADGFNPLCGDKLTLFLNIDDNKIIQKASFQGRGCAISTASASLMTDALKGLSVKQAKALFERFHQMVTGDNDADFETMDKLTVLAGVREFPARVKCATLAWHTLMAAFEQKIGTIASTE
tara:strand:+ start:215 stop:667 length:453 start_codon:yes stop_codon:yes gene_type:complete